MTALNAQAGCRAAPGQGVRLDQLPPEVLQRILAAVPHTDTSLLARLATVSRGLRTALQGPSCLWHSLHLGQRRLTHPTRVHTPADLLSLAAWLRSRCAQTSWLKLGIAPDHKLESLIGLLAPRLEFADIHGGRGATLGQAPVEHLAVYGSSRLVTLGLWQLAPSVQLDTLVALAGLRTLRLRFADGDEGSLAAQEPFPFALCNLSQLTELKLDYPSLRLLPDALSRLTALQRLGLRGSVREDWPTLTVEPGLGRMRSLTELSLEDCALPEAWPSFGGLAALSHHAFEDCLCVGSGLPAGCFAAPALCALTCQRVSPCGLAHLQPGELGALTLLTLGECRLREFPAAICQLHSLVELNLGCNAFDTLPRSISRLTNLEELELRGTDSLYVHTHGSLFVPVELAKLSKLCSLDLSNTAFTLEEGLGRALADIPNLWVQLSGSLPSKEGVRELMLLGVHLHQQGRFEEVLDWSY